MSERPYVDHDPGCEGGHVASVSCAEVARWRADARADPAYCQYGRNGYHSFDGDGDDARCVYGECARTLAEIRGTS